MKKSLLLRGARQLLTLRGPSGPCRGAGSDGLSIVHDGSVLIHDGVVAEVGPSRRVDQLAAARDAEVIDAHGAVVMPALIDASATIPETNTACRRLFSLAAAHGTGAIAIHGDLNGLRGLCSLPLPPIRRIPTWRIDTPEGLIARSSRAALAEFAAIDLRTCPPVAVRTVQSLGLGIRCRFSEAEDSEWIGLALALGAGIVDAGALSPAELRLLAETATPAVFTPAALNSFRDLVAAGGVVALGSGFGEPDGFTCSMQTVVGFLCRELSIPIADAIVYATRNSAFALGIAEEQGSIEVGKRADLLLLHISDYRDLPLHFGVNIVSKALIAGNVFP